MSNLDAVKKKNCKKILVSNVRDDFPRVVSENEALRIIKRNNMSLFEIDVNNKEDVDELFTNLASQLLSR